MYRLTTLVLQFAAALAVSSACAAQTQPAPAVPDPTVVPQPGRIPCETIRFGMTFRHPSHRTEGGRMEIDPSVHPTVGHVCPGSPAERAGFAEGDVLLEINGKDFRDRQAREDMRLPVGTVLVFRVRRGEVEHELTLRIPPPATAAP